MNFEAYLLSKKIDSAAFKSAEPTVWETWKIELEQMHPNSFTAQKLYLINPVRRKYSLKEIPVVAAVVKAEAEEKPEVKTAAPVMAKPKPVMRPKPKIS